MTTASSSQTPKSASFTISQATTAADISAISSLFTAYTQWLNIDLTFQSFSNELASLPGAYAPPKGALLLARSKETGEPLGCVALRPLQLQPEFHKTRFQGAISDRGQPEQYCEIKRLYILPAARGKGVARALIREILSIAKREGYTEALLDTLPRMTAAVAIYRSEGFEDTEKYYENPLEGVIYMSQRLRPGIKSDVST
jgi:ribosomal protein S18 acetylase RimI-like enzyme